MKKHFILFLCIGLFAILISSCEQYLDKAPESNYTEEEVFANYNNFKLYFDAVYNGLPNPNGRDNWSIKNGFPFYWAGIPRKFGYDQLTELADGGMMRENQVIKGGSMGKNIGLWIDNTSQRPVLPVMMKAIRTCNTALQKIKEGTLKDVDQVEIDDLSGQAHFVRAFAHFCVFRLWGPLPYLTNVIGPYDNWDLPRLSKHETLMRIAADFDTAATFFAKAGRMRRDNPIVSGEGHLNHQDQFRPNGVAAKAFKGRILLYAASPLNNEHGITDWEEAAEANWEAIQLALQNGYFLLSAANYKLNYVGAPYSDEQLWGWNNGALPWNNALLAWLVNGIFANTSDINGELPTQNAVDKFETIWGDPLNTQADRDAATALLHYNEQDGYKNRDPRFYIAIIYNGCAVPGWPIVNIYYESTPSGIQYSEFLNPVFTNITTTGYYGQKFWGGNSTRINNKPIHGDPIIRLGELYLNYAEAANEAYGPKTPAPGASLSAEEAINVIRQRIGQPDVLSKFTSSTRDVFRPRIKNERIVELFDEGSYFFDLKRWMDAPEALKGPMIGMNIEKVPVDGNYPIGFKHTRISIPAARQVKWKDEMYYFPFLDEDYYKMKNFDLSLNPRW